MGEGRLVS